MRRKSLFVRSVGVCLFSLLFSLVSLAQTEKAVENSFGSKAADSNAYPLFDFFSGENRSLRFPARFAEETKLTAEILSFRRFAFAENFSSASQSLQALRRRGDGFLSLLSIATGITQVSESPALEKRGLVSSSGQRPTANRFSVDGMSMNLGVALDETSLSRNAGLLPALTASGGMNNFVTSGQTQEISIKTMSGAKEQRVAGADINVASRAGTNQFHGSIFETFGNEVLNANDFFANSRGLERPDSRLNQFGGTLSGFIWRNKAWFFGGYEGLRLRQAGFGVSEVPTVALRLTSPGIYQPLLNAFPIPTGDPETSNGFAEFAASYTNPAAHDVFGLRIDVQPTSRLRIGGRFNFADSKASVRGDREYSLNTLRKTNAETGTFSAWTTFTPTSSVAIDGRINFSRHRIGQKFSIDNFGGADTSAAIFSTPFDFLKFDFAGKNAAIAVGNPIAATVEQFQTGGTVDWILGDHQLTFGAGWRRVSLAPGAARTERSVLFTRVSPTLNLTTARITELTRNVSENPEMNNFSLFANETWRIGSRLNLNLGLRWDADFAPKTNAQNFAFQNASLEMPDQLKNFAPRAGVAFDLFGTGRAVLRGGAGLYFDYGNGESSDAFVNSYPFASGFFAQNAIFTGTPTNPLKPLQVFDNNLQTPRALHVFAEYQQAIFSNHTLTATYTSSFGRKLYLTRTFLNADPDFNYIRQTNNDAESDFNALTLRFERRFSQGFSYNARYTLSKSKDNFSPDALRETNFVSADLAQERGSSDFDVRHQFSIYAVYDIPTFFGGWVGRLTEDWSLSAFANARTAFPVNVGYYRVNDFGKEFVRADLAANVPAFLNEDAIKQLNPNAFTIPVANRQGSLKRNSLRGFPLFQLDTSLQRRIRFTNEMRLEISINAYNVLNNTNYADMSGGLGTIFSNGLFLENEYFGKTTSVFGSGNFTPFYLYGGARTIQLSAKFVF